MADEFVVEDVGPPTPRKLYPWARMAVGQSFFVAEESGYANQQNSLAVAARVALGKGNAAVRKVDGGYRVWRLA